LEKESGRNPENYNRKATKKREEMNDKPEVKEQEVTYSIKC
jgi:hypothetical protein